MEGVGEDLWRYFAETLASPNTYLNPITLTLRGLLLRRAIIASRTAAFLRRTEQGRVRVTVTVTVGVRVRLDTEEVT